MSSLPAKLLAFSLCAATLGGCGLGAGPAPSAVKLSVTSDFGVRVLHHSGALKLRGQETVMSLLSRNYPTTTRYGGGFVESIDGLSGEQETSRPIDWFYYENGVQATKGAAATNVSRGDHIWWDRHDWSQTNDVPAVVGSFPEPFLNGFEGKRYPVRVECAQISSPACATARRKLRSLGIPAAAAGLGPASEPKSLRLIVGRWSQIGYALGAQSIERGPRSSGVYGLFSANGRSFTPLDQDGHRLRPLSDATGLIAATRQAEDAPIWVITGTDDAGVELAAAAFNEAALRDHFAVVVSATGTAALPEVAP